MVTAAPQSPGRRILVVEDDATVREVVARYLERDGHQVTTLDRGAQAAAVVARLDPDLIILDLMLPDISGVEVCRELRRTSPVPIIMVTALGEEADRVLGLEVGADDYVTKPFSPRELALRVASVLRRASTSAKPGPLVTDGDLVVDGPARTATWRGRVVPLTARELDLLAFLMTHPGQAFTREQLLDQVWGWSFGDHSTVTVHIKRLRRKVEVDPVQPTRIVTVWGTGYRYDREARP
ncbi:MAG: response regulator transcription factor [Geodermatophilaceae bacterium]|nr:response regulator transcription factor [Geodermatophilaceae bacterium]